jgi:DNA-binding Xre family transcriptional regulator
MTSTLQGNSELSNPNDMRRKIEVFVRRRLYAATHLIRKEREAARVALKESLAARGHGLILDPLDPRFDQFEVSYCEAVLRATADAWLEAYDVYDVAPDDAIWAELNKHKQSLVAARKGSLKQEAIGRAVRTGRNTAPGIARAEALGQEIERSTHALMKSLACEIEKRMMARKKGDSSLLSSVKGTNVHPKSAPNSASPIRSARMSSTVHSQVAVRRIEAFMEAKGLRQTEFARRANTTERTIRKIRKTATISRGMLADIAKALGISKEELLKDPEA